VELALGEVSRMTPNPGHASHKSMVWQRS